jgi:hypothetical protein
MMIRKSPHTEVASRVTRIVSGEVCNKGCPKVYCLKGPTTKGSTIVCLVVLISLSKSVEFEIRKR